MWELREACRDVVYKSSLSKSERMDVVWERLNDKHRPQTYAGCPDLFCDFCLLDLEEGIDPVLYLDRLERLQAKIEKLEALVNDKPIYA